MSKHNGGLGDAPIEPRLRGVMNALGQGVDDILNGKDTPRGQRQNGFILLVFPFNDHEGRCNYISNASRDDVVVLLKEQLARFQGQPEVKGRG